MLDCLNRTSDQRTESKGKKKKDKEAEIIKSLACEIGNKFGDPGVNSERRMPYSVQKEVSVITDSTQTYIEMESIGS